MFIFVMCDPKSKKAPQKDLVLVEIWLLIMADSEHTNFICDMIGAYYLWGWAIPAVTRTMCHTRRHKSVTLSVTTRSKVILSTFAYFFQYYRVDTL